MTGKIPNRDLVHSHGSAEGTLPAFRYCQAHPLPQVYFQRCLMEYFQPHLVVMSAGPFLCPVQAPITISSDWRHKVQRFQVDTAKQGFSLVYQFT